MAAGAGAAAGRSRLVKIGLNAKRPHSCKECKQSFRAKWKYNEHMLNHPVESKKEEGIRNETICEEGELTDNVEEGELLV